MGCVSCIESRPASPRKPSAAIIQAYEKIVEHKELISSRVIRLREELQHSMTPEEMEQILRIETKRKMNSTLTHQSHNMDHYRQMTFHIRDDDSYYESPSLLVPGSSNSTSGSKEDGRKNNDRRRSYSTFAEEASPKDAVPREQWSFSQPNAPDDPSDPSLPQQQSNNHGNPNGSGGTTNGNDVTQETSESHFARANSDEEGDWSPASRAGPGRGEYLLVPVLPGVPDEHGFAAAHTGDLLLADCCDDRLSPIEDVPTPHVVRSPTQPSGCTEINVNELSSHGSANRLNDQMIPSGGVAGFSFALPLLGAAADFQSYNNTSQQWGGADSPLLYNNRRSNNRNISASNSPGGGAAASGGGGVSRNNMAAPMDPLAFSAGSRTPNQMMSSAGSLIKNNGGLQIKTLALEQLGLPKLEASSSILRSPLSTKSSSRVRFADC